MGKSKDMYITTDRRPGSVIVCGLPADHEQVALAVARFECGMPELRWVCRHDVVQGEVRYECHI